MSFLQIRHISFFTELNANSLLEGKLRNVQYTEERANELRFLACLHIHDYKCIATGFVIATYLVMTANGALLAGNPINHVMILNKKRHVDKHLYEARDGSVSDSSKSGSPNHHLVVLTVSNFMNFKQCTRIPKKIVPLPSRHNFPRIMKLNEILFIALE